MNLNCFPRNLEKFFINFDKIHIELENISTLTRSDLQSLGNKLKRFWFESNNLEVIPADLFEDTRNLVSINFGNNKIKYVGRGAFDNLPKLKELSFYGNPIHDGYAPNHASVLKLIRHIDEKMLIVNELNACNQIKSDQGIEIEKLKAEKVEWQKSNKAQGAKIDELQLEIEAKKFNNNLSKNLLKIFNEMEAKLSMMDSKLDAKLKSVETKLDSMDLKIDSNKADFTSIDATCNALNHKFEVLIADGGQKQQTSKIPTTKLIE